MDDVCKVYYNAMSEEHNSEGGPFRLMCNNYFFSHDCNLFIQTFFIFGMCLFYFFDVLISVFYNYILTFKTIKHQTTPQKYQMAVFAR